MQRTLFRFSLFVVFASFLVLSTTRADDLPRSDATAAGFSKETLDRIPALLKDAVDKKQTAGASALVARHGKVVLLATTGMQDVEAKLPMSEKTICRIASMSKPITSVAVMILVDDGKLKVSDPLWKYAPEFKDMKVLVPSKDGKSYEFAKAEREITIHDLLTHSSGITYGLLNKPFVSNMYADGGVVDGLIETPNTIGDNVKKLAKQPLVCQPGAAWEYGLNTDVLGYVVEVVSGKTLAEFVNERIFTPLKMNDSSFIVPKEKRARLAALYSSGPDKTLARVDKPIVQGAAKVSPNYPTNDESKYYSGGAGLSSTISDYFRFAQMLLNRGELNGIRVLKADTVDQMTCNQLGQIRIQFPGNDLMGYGFGILSEKGKETTKDLAGVGNYGWGGAFGTFFWVDPKNDLLGIYMMQAFPPDFTLSTEVKKLVYEALK